MNYILIVRRLSEENVELCFNTLAAAKTYGIEVLNRFSNVYNIEILSATTGELLYYESEE